MEKKWIAATVLSAFLLTGAPTAAMAQNVTVTLPTFPVTLNGYEMQPTYDEYLASDEMARKRTVYTNKNVEDDN